MGTATLLVLCSLALLWGSSSAAEAAPRTRLIGYVDAAAQREGMPVASLVHPNLTHLVLTNAVKVDSAGKVHFRPAQPPSELAGRDVLEAAAKAPGVNLVIGLRGQPDDVALDELAEDDGARGRFVSDAAALAQEFGAAGLEIEWHSDDPAGGKPTMAPFDAMEQYHFSLLCRDLAAALRAGGRTLSVAVRPGRQEFADGTFVRENLDWLAVRAYSMRSLGDPHHASVKDMQAALDEWTAKGVPKTQLVLSTPLFGRPGAALNRAGDRNEALRASWREIGRSGLRPLNGDMRSDVFVDDSTGKQWWVSGLNTTQAKIKHVLENGYGGVAFRDLHHDSPDKHASIVEAAVDAMREHQQAPKKRFLAPGVVLFQRGLVPSRAPSMQGVDDGRDEF